MVTVTVSDMKERTVINEEMSAILFGFLKERSERVILSRPHREEIETRTFERLVAEAMGKIFTERDAKLAAIEKLSDRQVVRSGFAERSQAADMICEQAEEKLNQLDKSSAANFSEKDTLENDLQSFGLLKRQIRHGSLTKEGDWYDLCYFDKDAEGIGVLERDLFSAPVTLGDYQFIDPCFVDREGRIFAKICSSEREVTMELSEEDYKAFTALGIVHHVYPPQEKKISAVKATIIGTAAVVSVLGAALGITFAVKRNREKTRPEEEKIAQKAETEEN